MPIRAENRARYPSNWREISATIRERANHRCEQCGVPNHERGWRDRDGSWNPIKVGPLKEAHGPTTKPPFYIQTSEGRTIKIIEIVLTCAHIDHQPENCDPTNLLALCQRCHLRMDVTVAAVACGQQWQLRRCLTYDPLNRWSRNRHRALAGNVGRVLLECISKGRAIADIRSGMFRRRSRSAATSAGDRYRPWPLSMGVHSLTDYSLAAPHHRSA